ncbi:MAG TPA: hypothetical protein DCL54_15745 [Alphaproteobacteria bacterium]|nr:hypothetical protein [Alphaproteobacteria bacterium]HAJ48026.1 hypothetical protein [Alphaproteobacteria bacterium]
MSDDASRLPNGHSNGESLDEEIRRNLPRNYVAQLIHGMLAMTGFRLVNSPTFVPAYLHTLSGSDLVVGAAMAAQHFGGFVSSVFGAVAIEHRARVLPLGFRYGWMMRLSILGLALSAFFLEPPWVIYAVAGFLALLGIFGGMQNVVWNMLMAKTIPQQSRGWLLGLRFFLGGLTAAVVSWVGGQYLVTQNVLGNGYATTFLVAFGLTAIGLSLLFFVREPDARETRQASNVRARLMDVPGLLREDRNFRNFFWAQFLATAANIATPFYILAAGAKLGLTGEVLGTLAFILLMATTAAHLFWGWIGDRTGFRAILMTSLLVWACAAFVLIVATSWSGIILAFIGLGLGMAGFQLATQNMVLDFGASPDLPMRLALLNSSQSLVQGVGALGGGPLVWLTSYSFVLSLAIGVKLTALIILWRTVREPRNATRARTSGEATMSASVNFPQTSAGQTASIPAAVAPHLGDAQRQRSMGSTIRIRDLMIVGGAAILALVILAAWTQAWPFALFLALGVAGIAFARAAFVRMPAEPVYAQIQPATPAPNPKRPLDLQGHFAALIDRLPDPILIVDGDGRIVAGNQAFGASFTPAEPRKHVANVIRAPAVLDALDAVLVGAAPRSVEFTVMSSPVQSFEAHVSGVATATGKPDTVLLLFHDVTTAKRVEDMRADFVANASHELRTPLASLTGFIETLRGSAKDDPAAQERFLTIMAEQAARMRRLIDDLLSLSRIELNEHIRPSGSVNLGDVVEEVTSAMQPQAQKASVTISVDEPPSLPHVAGEREELVQVVTNLVDNAIKYGRTGGKVEVSLGLLRPEAGEPGPSPCVFVAVKDDGEGIGREHLPRLTERFYRVDVRRSREVGGTGLGLAIVKHIVNRHRGRMNIDSAPGEGSTFSVFLPLASIASPGATDLLRLPAAAKQTNPQN